MIRVACLVLSVVLGSAASASAQAIPNFSGAWSPKTGAGPLVITQTASTMTVTEDGQARTYNLDGSESLFERKGLNFNSAITAQARWVGSALVVTTTTVSPIGTWKDLEVYSLEHGGTLNRVLVSTSKVSPLMGTRLETYAKTTTLAATGG